MGYSAATASRRGSGLGSGPARGSPRPRTQNRSGSTGSAGRGPARSSADRAGSARSGARSATVSRQTLPARRLLHELRQRGADALLSLTLKQTFSPRPGDDHVVPAGLDQLGELPERLPHGAAHPIAGHGLAELPAHREPEPRSILRLVFAASKGVDDQ